MPCLSWAADPSLRRAAAETRGAFAACSGLTKRVALSSSFQVAISTFAPSPCSRPLRGSPRPLRSAVPATSPGDEADATRLVPREYFHLPGRSGRSSARRLVPAAEVPSVHRPRGVLEQPATLGCVFLPAPRLLQPLQTTSACFCTAQPSGARLLRAGFPCGRCSPRLNLREMSLLPQWFRRPFPDTRRADTGGAAESAVLPAATLFLGGGGGLWVCSRSVCASVSPRPRCGSLRPVPALTPSHTRWFLPPRRSRP